MVMMKNEKIFFGLTGFLMAVLILSSNALAQGKFAVITNPACPTLEKDEIKMVFLGYKRSVDGYPVELYISKDETVFSDFVQSVLGLRVSEFNSHWLKRALSGEGAGPKKITDDEIISRVRTTQCAIGVVSQGKATTDVKILIK
jgi:hypothetical protein